MAVRQNLRIRQGETWQFAYIHRDAAGSEVDLTNYEGRLTIRADFSGSSEAYLTSTGGDVQGTITLAADGTVTLDMTASQTSALLDDLSELLIFGDRPERTERFVEFIYDLSLIDGVVVTRALQGKVIVERGVTD